MTVMIRLLIVAFIGAMWYTALTDTASIGTKDLSYQLQRMARDTSSKDKKSSAADHRICYNTPCGWAVYVPFTRRIEYFMKNTCECLDSSYKCIRVDDDLSVSAYVYECRQNTTADDIESPEDAI
ncbi:uncharacterized protein LOC107266946 [Cephus cinctus]|uniref:Uncharacterized protein LOC107266946 n=1 Tax=Cephus cinctus TaxID=211228 RepID=A0AAJ7FII6_CEPCN|nr:uncharacterized protein LOC107266946 [Cephus cinctus]